MTSAPTSGHTRFEVLDGMRGIAAFSVMIFHYNCLGFTPANGFIAVDLFFILSGFVITHSYSEKLLSGKMTFRDFMARRLIRLYPMSLAGLVIAAPAFYALMQYGYYRYPTQDILMSILCNLFFLPYLSTNYADHSIYDIFPANYPSWSLFFELFVNLFCVALFYLSDGALKKLTAIGYMLWIAGTLWIHYTYNTDINMDLGGHLQTFWYGFPRMFYGFMFGIILYRLTGKGALPQPDSRLYTICRNPFILYAFLAAVLFFPFSGYGLFSALAVVTFFPALILFGATASCKSTASFHISRFLGWMSYPVYCLHIPMQRVTWILCLKLHHGYMVSAALLATIALSILLTRFYEEPVRRYLTSRIPAN